MTEKEIFEYTYSASMQSEVRKIREQYLPKEMSKLERLRALDAGVTKRGMTVSLAHGIVCALFLGLGMSCCMFWEENLILPGVIIGFIGLAGLITSYPIYNRLVKQDREKITPEILRLLEELDFVE